MGQFNFKTALFHIDDGPPILFEWVRLIMGKAPELNMTKRFLKRAEEREITPEILGFVKNFHASDWNLISCVIRTDKGKFVKSTWETHCNGKGYWPVTGFGDGAITISRKEGGSGRQNAVHDGELYDFVRRSNQKLMDQEEAVLAQPAPHNNITEST